MLSEHDVLGNEGGALAGAEAAVAIRRPGVRCVMLNFVLVLLGAGTVGVSASGAWTDDPQQNNQEDPG